jgi:hypothetical protein
MVFHVKKLHGLNLKQYYDNYIKSSEEGSCSMCGNEVGYQGYYKGYPKYCRKCSNKSEEKKIKSAKSWENVDRNQQQKRREETCMKKYGVRHNFLTKECTEKRWETLNGNKEEINEKRKKFWSDPDNVAKVGETRKNTFLERYGVENSMQLDTAYQNMRKTMESTGKWASKEEKSELEWYGRQVRRISLSHYDELYKKWDGRCYYTGEILVNNEQYREVHGEDITFNSNDKQPTVDHKISIKYGFDNNIPEEVIGGIDNLCICGKGVNSKKNYLTEEEFREKYQI